MSTSTPTRPTRIRRSQQDWEALARELLPELQSGRKISDFADRIGTNREALYVALARMGYDPHGRPMALKNISGSSPKTLAKRVAARRQVGTPWWQITAETGKSFGELTRLVTENGYSRNGEPMSNGDSPERDGATG